MQSKKSLNEIRKELHLLKDYEVLVYGSYAKGRQTPRSDIDIAILSRKKDSASQIKIWKQSLGKLPECYDIKVFELLPLEIKIGVINSYKVVFGNSLEISEYLYHFRKLWNDVKFRFYENQFSSFKEKLKLLRKAKTLGGRRALLKKKIQGSSKK